MLNSDTLKRTLAGGAVTTPLALLFNRYVLGNTSGRSAMTAGLIGALLGGTGGYIYDRLGHRRRSEKERALDRVNSPYSDITEDTFRDPEKVRALRARLIDEGASSEEADAYIARGQDNLARLDAFRKDPDKVFKSFASEDPLDAFTEQQYALYNSLIPRITPKLGKHNGVLNHYMGMEGMTKQSWQELLDMAGHMMSKDSLRARIMYHNNLQNAYDTLRGKQFSDVYKNPVALDYIALKAVPEALRKHIPVSHRMTALSRAISSRGHSYAVDRDIFYNPKQAGKAIRQLQLINQAGYTPSIVLAATGSPLMRNAAYFGSGLLPEMVNPRTPRPWGYRYKERFSGGYLEP